MSTVGLQLVDPFAWIAGACATAAILSAGASCTLQIDFTPNYNTGPAFSTDTIVFSFNDGKQDTNISEDFSGVRLDI